MYIYMYMHTYMCICICELCQSTNCILWVRAKQNLELAGSEDGKRAWKCNEVGARDKNSRDKLNTIFCHV